MPVFTYKARDTTGTSVKGKIEAPSRAELIEKLQKMGYMTTHVAEAGEATGRIDSLLERFRWISAGDKLIFYIQLSNMINAGITILTSLTTLARQIENKRLKETVEDVAKRVEAGSSLSSAFASHPKVFSRLFVNMIKAGEVSGSLDTVLLRYVTFFEK
jgi:type IV pilus assembly protein PilC